MRKRLLIVESNPMLRQVYRAAMFDERERWETVAADNALEALDLLERSSFDVAAVGLRLPGINGAELLGKIQNGFPRVSRIMIADITDQEEVARSLNSVHQFLARPFEVNALKAALARIGSLDAYLQDEKLQALVGSLETVPSFPSLYLAVMRELNSPDPSVERVADIIANDAGMTAKMLQIVNSAALGLARKISSPLEAVEYLGMGTMRSLVLSAHVFSSFDQVDLKGFSLNRLWEHAIRTGRIAQGISEQEFVPSADAEEAHIAGMLHEVGKLMLAGGRPELFQETLALAAADKIPLPQAELKIFGATHAGVAAYLFGLWGLPASIVEAVAFHLTPARSDVRSFTPLTAVHVASVLNHEMFQDEAGTDTLQFDMDYLASTGLKSRLDVWRAEAAQLARKGKN